MITFIEQQIRDNISKKNIQKTFEHILEDIKEMFLLDKDIETAFAQNEEMIKTWHKQITEYIKFENIDFYNLQGKASNELKKIKEKKISPLVEAVQYVIMVNKKLIQAFNKKPIQENLVIENEQDFIDCFVPFDKKDIFEKNKKEALLLEFAAFCAYFIYQNQIETTQDKIQEIASFIIKKTTQQQKNMLELGWLLPKKPEPRYENTKEVAEMERGEKFYHFVHSINQAIRDGKNIPNVENLLTK